MLNIGDDHHVIRVGRIDSGRPLGLVAWTLADVNVGDSSLSHRVRSARWCRREHRRTGRDDDGSYKRMSTHGVLLGDPSKPTVSGAGPSVTTAAGGQPKAGGLHVR